MRYQPTNRPKQWVHVTENVINDHELKQRTSVLLHLNKELIENHCSQVWSELRQLEVEKRKEKSGRTTHALEQKN